MKKEELLDKCIAFSVKINKLRKYLREELHEYNHSDQIQRIGTSIGVRQMTNEKWQMANDK